MFYNILIALRTISNANAQMARAHSCANHVQDIERSSRATCCVVRRGSSAFKFDSFGLCVFACLFLFWWFLFAVLVLSVYLFEIVSCRFYRRGFISTTRKYTENKSIVCVRVKGNNLQTNKQKPTTKRLFSPILEQIGKCSQIMFTSAIRVCLLVDCLTSQQQASVSQDGSAKTTLRAATLR